MGAGLYDPAFATLGRLYGENGRSAITTLTLFGGFASTVCWPLSAFLEARYGWRGACLVYARFQLAVALPVYLFVLPRETRRPLAEPASRMRRRGAAPAVRRHVRAASPARHHHHARLRDLDRDVGASPDGVAREGARARRGREPRRAGRAVTGDGARGRDADRALPSSDMDQDRRNLVGHGWAWRHCGSAARHHRRAACFMARGSVWKA